MDSTSGFSAADSKELASYRLTMETTKKVFGLMRATAQETANDPKVMALRKTKAEIEVLSKKYELTDEKTSGGLNLANAQTLNQMEAAIKSHPQMMGALGKAGLTPREYSKYFLASLMAGMVAGFQKSGMLKELPKELKEVNPENVKFMVEHEAELAAMQKEMDAFEK